MYSHEIESLLNSKKIKVGDRIRVIKGNLVHEGLLMPRIELGDISSLVIKLDNGYNIGIKYDKEVKLTKLTSELKPAKEEKSVNKIVFDKNLPIISIVGTGGTIASKIDYKTGGVYASFSAKDIVNQIPDLRETANIRCEQAMQIMSEDMLPENWIEIAKAVAKEINDGSKGIIVTHGTDTLHFTSAALSFILQDLSVPVAVVGAQRSSDRGSSDTVMNVACAANFVTNSDVAEVCVVMHENMDDEFCYAIRGTKCRKLHTSRRDAFRPINDIPIAKINWTNKKIEILNQDYKVRSNRKIKINDKLETKVAMIKSYPGLDPEIFDFYIDKGYKGFVIEGTGLGHVATFSKLNILQKIEKAVSLNIPVVMTPQALFGRVHPTIYKNLRELSKRGVIFLEDMLPETAYVKLMHVIPMSKSLEEIKKLMLTNIAGEITERSEANTFLV